MARCFDDTKPFIVGAPCHLCIPLLPLLPFFNVTCAPQ